MLAPMIAAQTVSQRAAGVSFSVAEIVGPVAGFAALGVAAMWVLAALLRAVPGGGIPPRRSADLLHPA